MDTSEGKATEELREFLIPVATSVAMCRLAVVASLAALVYDWLLCLGKEMTVLWPAEMSLPKFLYQQVRYGSLALAALMTTSLTRSPVTQTYCKAFLQIEGLTGPVGSFPVKMLMVLRVSALYGNSKRVSWTLQGLLVFQFLGQLAIVLWIYYHDRWIDGIVAEPIPGVPYFACIGATSAGNLWIYWIFSIVFDLALCILVIMKGFKNHRLGLGSSVLTLIVRDSILYYLAIFSVEIIAMCVWISDRAVHNKAHIGTALVVAIEPILCCRLVLNTHRTLRPRGYATGVTAVTGPPTEVFAMHTEASPHSPGLDSMGWPTLTVLEVDRWDEEWRTHLSGEIEYTA